MIPKFRGFRTKTEEWVEGNLIYREEPYQHDIVTPIGNCSTISYAVERDSIGQWTGLEDKNGVEIFEGDVISELSEQGEDWANHIIAEVVWHKAGFYGKEKGHKPEYPITEFVKGEVIGNIWENPELLEVSD